MEYSVYVDDGKVVVYNSDLAVKVDSARELYVKRGTKKKFKSIDMKIPEGMSREEKRVFMTHLFLRLEEKYKNNKVSNQHGYKENSE